MDRGAWLTTVHGVAKSRTRLSIAQRSSNQYRRRKNFILRRHLSKTLEEGLPRCSGGCLPSRARGFGSGWGTKTLCATGQLGPCAASTEPAGPNKRPHLMQLRPDMAKINK